MRIIPNASNRIQEGLLWRHRQPAYLKDCSQNYIATYPAWLYGLENKRVVPWDGTFNMPLERLASKLHKDCKMVNFMD